MLDNVNISEDISYFVRIIWLYINSNVITEKKNIELKLKIIN